MKKIAILVLALLMCFSCVSCISVDNKNDSDSSTSQSESQTPASSETYATSSQAESSAVESSAVESSAAESSAAESSVVESSAAESSEESSDVSESPVVKAYEHEVIHCMFTDNVFPSDFELCERYYYATEGGVLVDLALRFKNNHSSITFGKNDFSGVIKIDGKELKMDVDIENACDFDDPSAIITTGKTFSTIYCGEETIVHLSCAIAEAYNNKPAEVEYTICGDKYSVEISPFKASQPKLEDKIKLEIGKTYVASSDQNTYTITVKDAYIAESVSASALDAAPYAFEDSDVFAVVANIKNEGPSLLKSIMSYTELDGEFIEAENRIESGNKKDLVLFSGGFDTVIADGKEALIYFIIPVPKGSTASDGYAMRINLGNKAFYCMPKA